MPSRPHLERAQSNTYGMGGPALPRANVNKFLATQAQALSFQQPVNRRDLQIDAPGRLCVRVSQGFGEPAKLVQVLGMTPKVKLVRSMINARERIFVSQKTPFMLESNSPATLAIFPIPLPLTVHALLRFSGFS